MLRVKAMMNAKMVRYASMYPGSWKMTAAMMSSNTTVWPMNISRAATRETITSWIQLPSVTVWEEPARRTTCMAVPATRSSPKMATMAQRCPFRFRWMSDRIKPAVAARRRKAHAIINGVDTGKSGVGTLCIFVRSKLNHTKVRKFS